MMDKESHVKGSNSFTITERSFVVQLNGEILRKTSVQSVHTMDSPVIHARGQYSKDLNFACNSREPLQLLTDATDALGRGEKNLAARQEFPILSRIVYAELGEWRINGKRRKETGYGYRSNEHQFRGCDVN